MSYSADIAEKVEDYLNGELSPEESAAIEQQMDNDPSFADYVVEMQEVNEAIHYSGLSALREQVGGEIKDIPYSTGKPSPWLNYCSLFLIVGSVLTITLWPENRDETSSTIYHTNKNKDSLVASSTDEKSKTKSIEQKSFSISETTQEKTNVADNHPSSNPDSSAIKEVKAEAATSTEKTPSEAKKPTEAEESPSIPTTTCDKLFTVTSTPSCKDEKEGTITVYSDMELDYTYSLKGDLNTSGEFKGLTPGKYSIKINYAHCAQTETTVVEEKWCGQNKAYSFNPNYGEKWSITHKDNEQGTFKIYSGKGKLVYEGTFGNGQGSWDGTAQFGEAITMGNYIAMIEYEDGRTEKVQLTIIQ